jgi:hypothetical protein
VTGFIEHLHKHLVTTSNYNAIAYLDTLQITTARARPQSFIVFPSNCLITALDNGDSSASVLTLCPLANTTNLSLNLILRPRVSRPVCLGIKHPSGAYNQIFITVGQLRVCWYGVLSLTRGLVCRLQLLLELASAVILWSEPRGTRDHTRILLSQVRDFLFRRLLLLFAYLAFFSQQWVYMLQYYDW